MFDIGYIFSVALHSKQMQELESARWNKLTPDEQDRELRLREVRALERLADAAMDTRRDVHHHFFS